jgi:hypothetical protein
VSLGGGWTLVTTLPATSTGYIDEPTTRDFWSYAAYVTRRVRQHVGGVGDHERHAELPPR